MATGGAAGCVLAGYEVCSLFRPRGGFLHGRDAGAGTEPGPAAGQVPDGALAGWNELCVDSGAVRFWRHDHARTAGRPDSETGAGAREEAGVAAWLRCGLPDSGICLEPGFPDHQASVHQLHGIVGGGMVLFPAGPVLPADGRAEAELADILFLRDRKQCHFRVHVGGAVPPHAQFLPRAVYRVQRVLRGCGPVCLLFVQLRPDLGRAVLHVQKPDLHQGLGLFSALRS